MKPGPRSATSSLPIRATIGKAKAGEPSLLAGLLVDTQGERLTPSHAIKNGRRYRYYVSAALINEAGTDRARGWRLAAREIKEAVIRILGDALTSPASLVARFGAPACPATKCRKCSAGRPISQRRSVAHRRNEHNSCEGSSKVIVDEKTIIIKLRPGMLLGGDVPSSASEDRSDKAVELTAAVNFKRRGVETKVVLPGLAQQKHSSRCDPALIRRLCAGARGLRSSPPAVPDRSRSWPRVTALPGATFAVSLASPF